MFLKDFFSKEKANDNKSMKNNPACKALIVEFFLYPFVYWKPISRYFDSEDLDEMPNNRAFEFDQGLFC